MNEVHENTLTALRAELPAIKRLAGLVPNPDVTEVQEAADELRQNFPGLDDLTLAAFCTYIARVEYTTAREFASVEALGGAAAYASMAVELAGSLKAEQ